MKTLQGGTALVTGASGGIGKSIATALAEAGMDLMLVAYPGAGLAELAARLSRPGRRAGFLAADLRVSANWAPTADHAVRELGHVDVLVNNAGIEFSRAYHTLSQQELCDIVAVNQAAPMVLTRLLLPGMLERRRGHVVNISSLAGKSGPAYQEPYAATKAALTAFTLSLRATYRGTGVSASVICPSFVEAGIYTRLKLRTRTPAPAILAGVSPATVARAVVRSIVRDVPEIIVNRVPLRPVLALATLSPSFGAWVTRLLGVNEFFRCAAEAAEPPGSSPS